MSNDKPSCFDTIDLTTNPASGLLLVDGCQEWTAFVEQANRSS